MNGALEYWMLDGRQVMTYLVPRQGAPEAPLPCIYASAGPELAELMPQIARILEPKLGAGGRPFALVSPLSVSWDACYTPWPAEAGAGRQFTGQADEYLAWMTGRLMPAVDERYRVSDRWEDKLSIGYSLGGLAALYGLASTGAFGGGASISGALWYPGWTEYLDCHPVGAGAHVYLSLGRAEAKTRSRMMGRVAECTQETRRILTEQLGEGCVSFEWNNGNHFYEIPQRMARAIAWLMDEERGGRTP